MSTISVFAVATFLFTGTKRPKPGETDLHQEYTKVYGEGCPHTFDQVTGTNVVRLS